MSRTLPAALLAEYQSDKLQPFTALEVEFSDGIVRFWTGYGTINVNGQNWDGAGTVMSISSADEDAELVAQGMTFVLSGLDTAVISAVLNENYKLRPCAVYAGALDSNGVPVSSLYQLFSGRVDTIELSETGGKADITINAESRLIDLNRPRIRMLTDAEQKLRFSEDNSLAGIALLQDKQFSWGKA